MKLGVTRLAAPYRSSTVNRDTASPKYSTSLGRPQGEARRGGPAQGRADVLRRQALLVHAVPGLVHGRAQRVVDVGVAEAGGQPGVVAMGAAAEGMGGPVQPPAGGVE